MHKLVASTLLLAVILSIAIVGFQFVDASSEVAQQPLRGIDLRYVESSQETAVLQSALPSLPTDLFFSTGTEPDEYRFLHTFARADAETLQQTHVYIDDTIRATRMRGLGWSPTGEHFALFKFDGEICLLDSNFNLSHCFENKTWWLPETEKIYYQIMWSEDGQRAYFVADIGDMRSLIEADVVTGQLLRTIFQYDTGGDYPKTMYSTPDLDYVAIYGDEKTLGFGYRTFGVGVREVTTIELDTETTVTMPIELSEMGTVAFCDQFSPAGSYLTARTYLDDHQPGFVLFTPQGDVALTLPYDRLQAFDLMWASCPSWQADEQAFFFLAGSFDRATETDDIFIFKYSLPDDTLTQVVPITPLPTGHVSGDVSYPQAPLVVSPQGTHVAIQFGAKYAPNAEIVVLFPTGELVSINGPTAQGAFPIGEYPV